MPWRTLVPDLVTAFTDAPERSPLEASWRAGGEPELLQRVGKRQVQAGAVVQLLLGAPSSVYETPKSLPPATEIATPVFIE